MVFSSSKCSWIIFPSQYLPHYPLNFLFLEILDWPCTIIFSFLFSILSFLLFFLEMFFRFLVQFISTSKKKKNYHFYFNIEPFLICSLFLLFIASVLFPWISCIRMPLTLLKALIFYACIFSMLFFFCFTCYTLVSPALAYWLLALFCLLLSVRH